MRVLDRLRALRGRVILGGLAMSLAGPAAAQTAVKFSLDSNFDGPSAPFVVGIDRGYYKAEGLDVSVEAASALDPVTRVASGSYDMGVADINALIRFRDQNPASPVKAVFMVYDRPPFAIIARKSRGIAAPKDLVGKKLGAPAADAAFAHWRIFARANGIDLARATIENVGLAVREPMLAAGQLDAMIGASFAFVDLKERGVPVDDIVVMLMADYGVTLYGNAIIVNPKFAADKPEAVRAFLRAFLRSLKETVRNPSRAVDSVLKRNDLAKKEVEIERLRMAIRDNILTAEARASGYGGVEAARLDGSIDQIALAYTFKSKPKGADIFDAAFLPAASERRLD